MSLRTKSDVDRHAEDVFRRCSSENDKKLKSLAIGKQYLAVKAYDAAIRYFQSFLLVNENSPETYKLLGKCYQQIGKAEKAIASYKRSLELEPHQPGLVLLICELMSEMNLSDIGISTARQWCEKGSELFPNNAAVNSLRQKLVVAENKDPRALENFYLTELKSNQNDETLLINLVNLYADSDQFAAAHKKVLEYQGNPALHQSLEWHRCLSKVYQFCLRESSPSSEIGNYLLEAVSVNDRYLSILHRVKNDGLFDEALDALHLLDQLLTKLSSAPGLNGSIDRDIQKHYLAQLAYHIAVLVLKKLIREGTSKDEAVELIAPSLLFAQASPFDLESPVLSSLDTKYRAKMRYIVDDAIFRVIQSNLTLRNWFGNIPEKEIIAKIKNSYTSEARCHIFSELFVEAETAVSSCWLECGFFDKLPVRLLSISEIITESKLFSYERRSNSSYHDLVWLGVQTLWLKIGENHILPHIFSCQTFPSWPALTQNLTVVTPNTLSKLDIDSFLYLSVYSSYLSLIESKADWHKCSLADAVPSLVTDKQLQFWAAVQKSRKNELGELGGSMDSKSLLIKGIESVRLIGQHGLDTRLLILVARTFEGHARIAAKQRDALLTSAVEMRAFLYWSNVIRKLELAQVQDVYQRVNPFFPLKFSPVKKTEIAGLLEEGRFFIAYKKMRNEDFNGAIEGFRALHSADAALHEALIYKRLALNEIRNQESDDITAEMRAKHNTWLMKAKEAIGRAEGRLGDNSNHPMRVELGSLAEEIEGRLVRYDRDYGNETGADSLPSSIDSNNEGNSSTYLPKSSFNSTAHDLDFQLRSNTFTPKRHSNSEPKTPNLKEMIASQVKMLKIVEQLSLKVERVEQDVNLLAKSVKRTEQKLDQARRQLSANNPLLQAQMAMLFPQFMQAPAFFPNLPQAMPPMIPPFLPPFLPPHMMPPFLVPPQNLNVSQLQNPSLIQPSVIPGINQLPNVYTSQYATSNTTPTTQSRPNVVTSSQVYSTPSSSSQITPEAQQGAKPENISTRSQGLPGYSASEQSMVPTTAPLFNPTTPIPNTKTPQSQSLSFEPNPSIPASNLLKPSTLTQAANAASVQNLNSSASTPIKLGLSTSAILSTSPQSPGKVETPPRTEPSRVLLPQGESTPLKFTTPAPPLPTPKVSQKVSEPLFNLLMKPSMFADQNRFSATSSASSTTEFSGSPVSKTNGQSGPDSTQDSVFKDTPPVPTNPIFKLADSTFNSFESSPLSNRTSLDFAQIAKNTETQFRQSGTFKGFEGQGSKVFDSPSVKDSDGSSAVESAEDFVPTVEFQPLIALPELVDVKTGEEGLTVLYEGRCKLMRFDCDLKEWKERGIGNMKILHDPARGTVRLLMRREQVHKVCCNQNLPKNLNLKPVASSETAWTWCGVDFSEGEEVVETFAVKFKDVNLARTFLAAVEDAKKKIGETDDYNASPKKDQVTTEPAPLSELFKPEAGSWECSACYTRNSKDKTKCLACETPNPSNPSEPTPTTQKLSLGPSVIQLGANTSNFQFGIPPSATSSTSSTTNGSQGTSFGQNTQLGAKTGSFQFGTLQSSVSSPTFGSAKPSFGSTEPTFGSTKPSFGSADPTFGSAKPTFGSVKPTFGTSSASSSNSFHFGIAQSATSNLAAPKASFDLATPKFGSETTPKPDSKEKNGVNGNNVAPAGSVAGLLGKSIFSFELPSDKNGLQEETHSDKMPESQKNLGTPLANGNEPVKTFSFNFTNGSSGIFNGSSSFPTQNGTHPNQPISSGSTEPSGLSSTLDTSNFSLGQRGSGDDTHVSSDDEATLNDAEDSIHFEPIVPLPDEIIPTTGEEDEDTVYCHLAKLFRYRDGEWKERGLGDIKILRHKVSGALRFVMRRKPIDKVCLNHLVTKDLSIQPKDAKSWTWTALDFSDQADVDPKEMKPDVFSLRFKNPEIAQQFKDALDSALDSKPLNGAG